MNMELFNYWVDEAKSNGHTTKEAESIALMKMKGDQYVQENKNSSSNCTSGIRKEK